MILLLIIALALVACELAYFRLASHYNIIDRPNRRSSHATVAYSGGGIVFYFAALAFFIVSGGEYPWFMLGLTLIAAISLLDDIRPLPIRLRIVVHFISVLLMFCQLGLIALHPWWIGLIAMIICTGIINAYNFMDGIDGITGAYSMAILIPLAIVNSEVSFIDPELIWITAIAVLIFCFFNCSSKVRCFAGDVGSVSIAFILLFMVGALIMATGEIWHLIFFAVYGADATLTICHRLMLHENIFEPHRKHAYQIMANEMKIPHMTVAGIYFALQFAISLGAIYLPIDKWLYFTAVIALLAAAYLTFMKKNYHLHQAYLNSLS